MHVSDKVRSFFAAKLGYRYSAIQRNTMPCLLSKQLSSATNDPDRRPINLDETSRLLREERDSSRWKYILLSSLQKVSGLIAVRDNETFACSSSRFVQWHIDMYFKCTLVRSSPRVTFPIISEINLTIVKLSTQWRLIKRESLWNFLCI